MNWSSDDIAESLRSRVKFALEMNRQPSGYIGPPLRDEIVIMAALLKILEKVENL